MTTILLSEKIESLTPEPLFARVLPHPGHISVCESGLAPTWGVPCSFTGESLL